VKNSGKDSKAPVSFFPGDKGITKRSPRKQSSWMKKPISSTLYHSNVIYTPEPGIYSNALITINSGSEPRQTREINGSEGARRLDAESMSFEEEKTPK
jgi:hypothetical protein